MSEPEANDQHLYDTALSVLGAQAAVLLIEKEIEAEGPHRRVFRMDGVPSRPRLNDVPLTRRQMGASVLASGVIFVAMGTEDEFHRRRQDQSGQRRSDSRPLDTLTRPEKLSYNGLYSALVGGFVSLRLRSKQRRRLDEGIRGAVEEQFKTTFVELGNPTLRELHINIAQRLRTATESFLSIDSPAAHKARSWATQETLDNTQLCVAAASYTVACAHELQLPTGATLT